MPKKVQKHCTFDPKTAIVVQGTVTRVGGNSFHRHIYLLYFFNLSKVSTILNMRQHLYLPLPHLTAYILETTYRTKLI